MSPRLRRDVSGPELAKLLQVFGYAVTRRKGSHLRLTTSMGSEHHVTVPNHEALRTGTINSILKNVAGHADHRRLSEQIGLRRPRIRSSPSGGM